MPLTSFSKSSLGITFSVPHDLMASLLLPALRISIPSWGIFRVKNADLAILSADTAHSVLFHEQTRYCVDALLLLGEATSWRCRLA